MKMVATSIRTGIPISYTVCARSILLYVILALGVLITAPMAEAQLRSDDRVSFGHTVSLSPAPGVPSLLSVVSTGDAPIERVRALLLVDGELLTVPLPYQATSQSFRGRFPTPERAASYQFQFILRSGRAILSESFQLPLACGELFSGKGFARGSPQEELMRLQLEESRLRYAILAVKRLSTLGAKK